jgi:hypothetical protein
MGYRLWAKKQKKIFSYHLLPITHHLSSITLIHHQTTGDTEKLMDLKTHNILSDFHLCALFSESSLFVSFPQGLESTEKNSVYWLKALLKAPTFGTVGCGSCFRWWILVLPIVCLFYGILTDSAEGAIAFSDLLRLESLYITGLVVN